MSLQSKSGNFCTPEEIKLKKQQAEERHKKFLQDLKLKKLQNNENNKDSAKSAEKSSTTITISAEQKAEIEKKRLAAIERAKAKNISLGKFSKFQPANVSSKINSTISNVDNSIVSLNSNKLVNTNSRNENRLKLPDGLSIGKEATTSTTTVLTPQQKAEVERKRLAALERAKANNILPRKFHSVPGNQQSKSVISEARHHPYQRPSTDTKVPPLIPKIPVICSLEIISEKRFVARLNNYNEAIINEFKKIPSKSYDQKTRNWSFSVEDYEKFCQNLENIKNFVKVEKVPEFVMKHIQRAIVASDESCLDSIESELTQTLLDFQKESICYGIARGGRVLLGDDMGLGKTRQALAIADFYRNDWPLLILTTASLRIMWRDQIVDLLPNVNVHDIRVMETSKESIGGAKVVICSYSGLENNMKRLMLHGFGMVIYDESHSLKNVKAKQTKNATELADKAFRVVLITGTPALSRPAELFPQLAILDSRFADWWSFTRRYCKGHQTQFGWDATGSSNLDELNVVLRKKFIIRRTKEELNEVFSGLGKKLREVVMLKDFKINESNNKIMKGFAQKFQENRGALKQQKSILMNWYTQTAELKAESVCRYIEDILKKNDEKLIIFAAHFSVMDALSNCLTNNKVCYVRIDGKTSSDVRQLNVNRFQNDSNVRCAILSIRACSAGITLTAASTVIFTELDWTPSMIIQAEGRVHRIGQEKQVKIIFLIAPGTADDEIWNLLNEKQKNLTKVGLVGVDENLSENLAASTFDAGTSAAGIATNSITNYFPSSQNTSKSSESFYTCEAEIRELVDDANDNDDDDIDMEEVLQKVEEMERVVVTKQEESDETFDSEMILEVEK
ncbi:CLUMA_CG014355, isoform A, partial [Clunio marinus]